MDKNLDFAQRLKRASRIFLGGNLVNVDEPRPVGGHELLGRNKPVMRQAAVAVFERIRGHGAKNGLSRVDTDKPDVLTVKICLVQENELSHVTLPLLSCQYFLIWLPGHSLTRINGAGGALRQAPAMLEIFT
jgi:hypothetical protein